QHHTSPGWSAGPAPTTISKVGRSRHTAVTARAVGNLEIVDMGTTSTRISIPQSPEERDSRPLSLRIHSAARHECAPRLSFSSPTKCILLGATRMPFAYRL